MTETIDSVGIAFPDGWTRFPLEKDEFEKFARTQREAMSKAFDLTRTAERRYEVMLQSVRNDLRRDNVRLVATLTKGLDAEPDADADGTDTNDGKEVGADLLAASCIVSTLTKADVGANVPLTVNTIMVGMSRGPKIDESDEFTKRIADIEAPEVVELPAGEAVRLIRLHEMRSITQPDKHIELFVQHFLVPLDDTGDNAVIVTFSSPSIAYARPLSDLFNSMMTTFRTFSGNEDLTDPLAIPAS